MAELARLLESTAFRTSRRCREFLDYIVVHTIKGPSSALKERSIGIELFQLPQDFDTGQHTVVRVTANEVRKKLAQQYLAENGTYHSIKIELPPGSYSAAFSWGTSPADPPIPAPPEVELAPPVQPDPPSRANWHFHPVLAGVAIVAVIAGVYFLWRTRSADPVSVVAEAPGGHGPAPSALSAGGDLRMFVGSTSLYLDRSGRTWGMDRFFSGGSVLVRSSEKIVAPWTPTSTATSGWASFVMTFPCSRDHMKCTFISPRPGWPILSARNRAVRGSASFGSPPTENRFWNISM